MNKLTTALLAALVLTQVPSAIESLHLTTCITTSKNEYTRRFPKHSAAKAPSRALTFCNGGPQLW